MKGLKATLWITAIGCFATVPFVFLPWSILESITSFTGHDPIPDIPVVTYYVKALFITLGFIGIYFIILARNPLKYGPMLYLGGYGLVLFGLLALFLGFTTEISPVVYRGDAVASLTLGIIILAQSSKCKKADVG